MTEWEYLTTSLLVHNTKQTFDQFGQGGREPAAVMPGSGGSDSLAGYFKRLL